MDEIIKILLKLRNNCVRKGVWGPRLRNQNVKMYGEFRPTHFCPPLQKSVGMTPYGGEAMSTRPAPHEAGDDRSESQSLCGGPILNALWCMSPPRPEAPPTRPKTEGTRRGGRPGAASAASMASTQRCMLTPTRRHHQNQASFAKIAKRARG
jgi:hypothetical protein